MKRILSSILAIVMMFSVFSVLTVTASAAEDASKYQVTTTGFKNGEITFNISIAPNQTIYDAMVSIKFDKTAVSVKTAGPAMTKDSDGNQTEVIDGLYANGISYYNDSCYTFAYTTSKENGYKIGSTAKSIFTITFKALNANVAPSFDFYAGDNDSTILIVSHKNISQLSVPEIASATSTANSVVLTWGAVSGAKQYKIYKHNGSVMTVVATVGADVTSYEDKSVETGKSYTYAVSAVDNANGETEYKTIEVTHQLPELSAPSVSIKNTATGIEVTWNSIENAQSYIVYRRVYNASTKKWSGWSAIKIGVTETSCIDSGVKLGIYYKYTVRAVNGDVKSKYVSTSGLKYNVTPVVKVTNTSAGVKVTWTTMANATGYRVYSSQYDAKTKKWSSWKNRGTAKATATAWTDKNVVSGTYYRYTVRAVDGSVLSSYKASSNIRFLSQPTVKFANNAAGIKVAWNKVAGATGYTIYRSEYTNGKWSTWKNMGTVQKNTTVSWVDKSVVSGVTYKYTVRAVNGNNKSSYLNTNGLLYLAQPTVTVKAVSNGINVAWSQCEGATGYTVYRSQYDAKTKKWTKWQSMGTAKAEKSNWTDKKATKGVTYRYTVRAVNADTGAKSTYVASKSVKR